MRYETHQETACMHHCMVFMRQEQEEQSEAVFYNFYIFYNLCMNYRNIEKCVENVEKIVEKNDLLDKYERVIT